MRRIYLNAFTMNGVVHQSPGLWTRPENQTTEYNSLDTWIELAKLLERGRFDAMFLADSVGVNDNYLGTRDAAVRRAAHIPIADPMLLIPSMAHATEHLGFGFTSSILQYNPFVFSRLVSTLDHLTDGRVAWNIVTSYLDSAAKHLGLDGLVAHDERYSMADEYCSVCYKLWEACWADDAVVKDLENGIYADPTKVFDIAHEGKYFRTHGCHLVEPSPQRTPVLFQAGASPRGQAFAAEHAECVFLIGSTPDVCGSYAKSIRDAAQARGRSPEDVICYAYMKIITGDSDAEAQRKYNAYQEDADYESTMVMMSGWSGIDFGQYEPDMPVRDVETNALRTFLKGIMDSDPTREWRMRDIADFVSIGGAGPVLVGGPERIADELERWVAAGIDGFNLAYSVSPGSFEDFIDGVVPILQKRGRMQSEYATGTLREKLYGRGRARLSTPHPAALAREAPKIGRSKN